MLSTNEFQIFTDVAFSNEDGSISFGYAMFSIGNLVDVGAFKSPRILNFEEAETRAFLFVLRRDKSLGI